MFLPFIIFLLLIGIGVFLLIFGVLGWGNEKGIAFFPLAGIIFLITGALLWTSGLELNQVSTINTTTDIISISYQTVTVSDGSPLWVVANAIFFGGFLIVLIGFGRIISLRREAREEETEHY